MTSSSRFCTECGSPLPEGARFCGHCGEPVRQTDATATPETTPPPAPQATPTTKRPPFLQARAASNNTPVQVEAVAPAETAPAPTARSAEVIATMVPGLLRKKGFLGMASDTFVLMGTPTRLVFAYIDRKTMNAFVNEARLGAKSQGKGWLGQIAAQMSWVGLMQERLQAMGVEAVLKEYPGSFFIPNQSISRVRVHQGHSNDDEAEPNIKLTFDTTGGRHKFELPPSMGIHVRELKRRLQQTLGAIVR